MGCLIWSKAHANAVLGFPSVMYVSDRPTEVHLGDFSVVWCGQKKPLLRNWSDQNGQVVHLWSFMSTLFVVSEVNCGALGAKFSACSRFFGERRSTPPSCFAEQ